MKFVSIFAVSVLLIASVAHAQIFSTTQSEADTGGNTSGSGTVIQGSASSRVEVRNTTTNSNTNVRIEIETEENGETHKETLYERLESRNGMELRYTTSTSGGSANVRPSVERGSTERSSANVRVRVGEVATTSRNLSNLFYIFRDAMPGRDISSTSSARAAIQAQIASDAENPGFLARVFAKFRVFWGF